MKAVDTIKLSDSVTIRIIRHGPPTEKTVKPPVGEPEQPPEDPPAAERPTDEKAE
jgi:hypothetical protein